jgi:hypothetical protein
MRTILSKWTQAWWFPLVLAWSLNSVALEPSSTGQLPHQIADRLAIMRTILSKWTRAWWSFELGLRLLASDNKDQPPLPDHLGNLLIWADSVQVIPPWAPSWSPIIPATLIIKSCNCRVWLEMHLMFWGCNRPESSLRFASVLWNPGNLRMASNCSHKTTWAACDRKCQFCNHSHLLNGPEY